MAIDFNKWNEEFGGKAAVEDLQNAAKNEFSDLPDGNYICKLEKLELGETKDHRPMVKGMFRITKGNHRKQCIFYNQVFTRGFPQHKALEFLRELNVFDAPEVDFDGDFENFNDLLLDMAEEAEGAGLTFEIEKSMDGDYQRLKVIDTYED